MTTVHRPEDNPYETSSDADDRVGEAIETYLSLIEQNAAPDPEEFAARYPDLSDDILAALEGLELVHGLVGHGSGSQSGGPGNGPGRNLESGRRIAGYRIVRELGRGGMGTVYEAVHVGLDRPVALKVLGSHAAPDSSARRRFLNEARTAAGLHHTHIVPVFDVGQAGGLCYYAMQKIEGSGLELVVRHLRQNRPFLFSSYSTHSERRTDDREATSSGLGSRLSRLLDRVSSSIPWRNHPGGSSHPETPPLGNGGPLATSDATASWIGLSRSNGLEPLAAEGSQSLQRSALGSSLASALGKPQDNPDATPPFLPPRGTAYFRWVATVGLQAAEALAHAHQHGVIHRDVKPSNLLIDDSGAIWVTDFGLARRLADPGLTHHDSLLGTPRYMSPEQARTGAIDGRTDVYSLGATLYELLTYRPPFDGTTAAELLEQIGGREPVAPREISKRIPRDLETIVLKTLAKRPSDRYTNAAELAEDLTRFLNHEPVKARRISPMGRAWRVARRHPGITSVTAVATAAVLAIATYAYLSILKERNEAIQAGNERQIALNEKEKEASKAQAAAKWALSANAENLFLSDLPNRRAKGIDLLEKIADPEKLADLPQDQGLTPERLRDQAVDFLILRDVEPRPAFQTGPTRGVKFGVSGDVLAALSEDGEEIGLWNVKQRKLFETISLVDHPEGPVPVNALGEPASRSGSQNSGSGNRPFRGPFDRGPFDRMSLAGHLLAAIRPDDRGILLFDARTGAPMQEIMRPNRAVLSVQVSPSADRLLTIERKAPKSVPPRQENTSAKPLPSDSGRREGEPPPSVNEFEVLLWDRDKLTEPLAVLDAMTIDNQRRRGPVFVTAFGPDGRTVAVASNKDLTYTVALHSAATGEVTGQIDTQSDALASLAFGSNNVLAVAASNTIQFWDRETRTFLSSLSSNRGMSWIMRFNAQGTLLAAAVGNQIELWDTISHKIMAVLPASELKKHSEGKITDLSFTPDGLGLVVGGHIALTASWRISDFSARTQLAGFAGESRDQRVWLSSLVFSPQGGLAIGTSNGETWFYGEGRNRCTNTCKTVAADASNRGPEQDRKPNQWTAIQFDARGRLIAHNGLGLRVWNGSENLSATPSLIALPPGREGAMSHLARSGDGHFLAVARSTEISIWQTDHPDRVRPVVPPDGMGKATTENEDPSGRPGLGSPPPPPSPPGEPKATTGGPRNLSQSRGNSPRREFIAIQAIQLAPRAERVYFLMFDSGSTTLNAWTLNHLDDHGPIKARKLEMPGSLPNDFNCLALRSDGSLLAASDRSGAVTLIDTASLQVVGRIIPPTETGPEMLHALAFSPDGKTLACGLNQGQILIWTVENHDQPRLAMRLPGQQGMGGMNLAFDAKGDRLASSRWGPDPLVEIWNLSLLRGELARLGLDK